MAILILTLFQIVFFSDAYSILETVGDARTIANIFTDHGCEEGVEWQYR